MERLDRMDIKNIAHYMLPPFIFDVTRPLRQARAIRAYRRNRQYAYGYSLYRQRVFRQAITDPSLLECMRSGAPLPLRYGIDVDERCIEFPWALSHLESGPEVLLDAGSTLNHDYIVTWPGLINKSLYMWSPTLNYILRKVRAAHLVPAI
jgi:hypothetical protein